MASNEFVPTTECERQCKFGLTPTQMAAAELLEVGGKTQKEVAAELGVHRNTVSNWYAKDNFRAAMRWYAEEKTRQSLRFIRSKSKIAIEKLWEMAENSKDKRVSKEIYMYFVDRDLGKITSKVEIEDKRDTNDDFDMDAALQEIANNPTPIALVSRKTG